MKHHLVPRLPKSLLAAIFLLATFDVDAQRGKPQPPPTLQRPPAYNPDPLGVIETQGIRLGMTLAEAKLAIAKFGAELRPAEATQPHHGFVEGPSTREFQRFTQPGPDYTGPRLGRRGDSVLIYVFPKDTQLSLSDDSNLVVFFVSAQAYLPSDENTVFPYRRIEMPVYESTLRQRYPEAFHRKPSVRSNAEQTCADAGADPDHVLRVAEVRRAGGDGLLDLFSNRFANAAAANRCRAMLTVVTGAHQNGYVNYVNVTRSDVQLARQAADQLAKVVGYNADTKVYVERELQKRHSQ
jgi:hypothetical protein